MSFVPSKPLNPHLLSCVSYVLECRRRRYSSQFCLRLLSSLYVREKGRLTVGTFVYHGRVFRRLFPSFSLFPEYVLFYSFFRSFTPISSSEGQRVRRHFLRDGTVCVPPTSRGRVAPPSGVSGEGSLTLKEVTGFYFLKKRSEKSHPKIICESWYNLAFPQTPKMSHVIIVRLWTRTPNG